MYGINQPTQQRYGGANVALPQGYSPAYPSANPSGYPSANPSKDTTPESEEAIKRLKSQVERNEGVNREPEGYSRDRHLKSEPEFNSFEFRRKYVTYEEKERAVNRLMDTFESQKTEYNKERQILCDNIVQFVANYQQFVEWSDTNLQFRRIQGRDEYALDPCPQYPLMIRQNEPLTKERVTRFKKKLVDSLAMDSRELEKALGQVSRYTLKDFKKDLLKLSVGGDVVDLATGAIRSMSSLQGSTLSELTRAGAKGAFKVATDTECSDGQFVYVNGEKICIPFRVTFDEDEMNSCLDKMIMSTNAEKEKESYDKYVSLLASKSYDDSYNPNIQRIIKLYTSQLDNLYQSYISAVKDAFQNTISISSNSNPGLSPDRSPTPVVDKSYQCDDSMIPVMTEIYLDFEGIDETDVQYSSKKRDQLTQEIYGNLNSQNSTRNKVVTDFVVTKRFLGLDEDAHCALVQRVLASLGLKYNKSYIKGRTNQLDCQNLCRDDEDTQLQLETNNDGNEAPLPFSCIATYNCIRDRYLKIYESLRPIQSYTNKKYREIVQKYSQEKSRILSSTPAVKGLRELKPENSQFVDIMKIMGSSEQCQMMFYGNDSKLFPVTNNFVPKELSKVLKKNRQMRPDVIPIWYPFIDYQKLNAELVEINMSEYKIKYDTSWMNYAACVLPFYRMSSELDGDTNFRYMGRTDKPLDASDETVVPDSDSDSFWVQPKNIPNLFFWHMFHKHRINQLSSTHGELQKSIIKNFLSLLEIIRILDEERIKKPGYGTESLPPKLKRFADIAMKNIFQPLKIGLSDLFQRTEDAETPVLRCLQKVNLQNYMGGLRDLKYSSVKSFASLEDSSLRAIVEQKLNLTEENKIKLAKAVECLQEYLQSTQNNMPDSSSEDTSSTPSETPPSLDTPDTKEPLSPEQVNLQTKLDHEIRKEQTLESEIKKDETEITHLEKEKQELSEVSKQAVDKLKSEIDDLTRKISVMRQRNKRMSRSINKRTKKWVTDFDFARETVLQQREEYKTQLEILQRQKANKEQQMKLMKILILELEKKREIDRKRQETKMQQMQRQMQKITEEMQEIHNNETQQRLTQIADQNKQQLSDIQQKLESLQNENTMLKFQNTNSSQPTQPIPLFYSRSEKKKTRKKKHRRNRNKTPKRKKPEKSFLDIFV
uniref:Uncharacterized protein n=1 Tax=viral metagenome TaxID=1070528 RepID=A0A6C0F7L7_9ZZZZ